ncbi:hypothetical protein QFC21_001941 [Naganishia friedmannii]|uniref:Uncharacterized protein n=1 Tax=Naganishia friedmannii TaxID=89922 RepID=A0ACC2W077_9TREE|nr:hypothetical protein QFC21_001941 [Naganishia friedmannii]
MSRRPPPTLSANLGAYDNKLVASTLSLPPPPSSAHESQTSPIASVFPALHHVASTTSTLHAAAGLLHSGTHHPTTSSTATAAVPVSRSLSQLAASLPSSAASGSTSSRPSIGSSVEANSHPSHPSSPWSMLSLHILPIFNGVPLLTPIEDLNLLAESHVQSCRTRSPRRYHRLLSSDLQELISSGMLTLRAKLEPPITSRMEDPAKLISRVAEVWGFFFALLPTMQAVFLPISLLDNATWASPTSTTSTITTNARRLLLSGFLLHILLPILPFLLDALDPALYSAAWRPATPLRDDTSHDPTLPASPSRPRSIPTPDHLARIKHLALILSTQSRSSDFFTLFEQGRAPPPSGMKEDEAYVSATEQREFDQNAVRDAQDRADLEDLLDAVVRLRYGVPPPRHSPVPLHTHRARPSDSGLATPRSDDSLESMSMSEPVYDQRRRSSQLRRGASPDTSTANDMMRSSTKHAGFGTGDEDGNETEDEDSAPTRRQSAVIARHNEVAEADMWGVRRTGGVASDGTREGEEGEDGYPTIRQGR